MNHGRESAAILELAAQMGRGDLFEWIEEQARRLAKLGRTTEGTVRIGRALQRACGVTSVAPSRMAARAQLRVDDDCFSIAFNPVLSVDVQRFAIAHEIGHTLWMELVPGEAPRHRCAAGEQNNRTIEMLCDYFAGALLVPRDEVKRIVRLHQESGATERSAIEEGRCPLELVPGLARRFRVQRRIAAWRLLLVQKLSSWVVVRVQDGLRRSERPLLEASRRGSAMWEVAWYETGAVSRKVPMVEGYRVPFDGRRRRRRIPAEMIPMELTAQARLQALDSRWWDGIEPEPAARVGVPFRRRRGRGGMMGLAAEVEGAVYIGIDREYGGRCA